MSTKTLSKNNPDYISRHRYYELKNYCLQYYEWAEKVKELEAESLRSKSFIKKGIIFNNDESVVERLAEEIICYKNRMSLIQHTCLVCDPAFSQYLFKAVTEGLSYDQLNAVYDLCCGREYWYKVYRHFFWLLDKRR